MEEPEWLNTQNTESGVFDHTGNFSEGECCPFREFILIAPIWCLNSIKDRRPSQNHEEAKHVVESPPAEQPSTHGESGADHQKHGPQLVQLLVRLVL